MHASSPHQSPLPSLSPLSSRTAAEYERESIKRLKMEVRGLTTALNTMKKGSKEWVMLNSKLEIAKDELNCSEYNIICSSTLLYLNKHLTCVIVSPLL